MSKQRKLISVIADADGLRGTSAPALGPFEPPRR
jgi:hypothetical protein